MYATSFIQLSIHIYVDLLCNTAVKLEQLSSVLENDTFDWLAYVWRHKG